MKGIVKSVKLLEEAGEYGFLVELIDDGLVKTFGGITDKKSLRKFFFGILSVLNNYDIADLANIKNKNISCIVEKPDSLFQRVAAIGYKNKFLFHDKNQGWISKKLSFKERKLLKSINTLQTAKVIKMDSISGTICMTLELDSGYQGAAGPNLFVGLGYPLVSRELSSNEEDFVADYSSSYIASFIKTIMPSKYLYKSSGDKCYEVEYEEDEKGEVVSLGSMVYVEGRNAPVFINKSGNSYNLEDKQLKKSIKELNRK